MIANLNRLNHDEVYHKPRYQLLKKESLVGPVTALALETCSIAIDAKEEQIVDVELCLIARGPYVNIIPLGESHEEEKVFTHLALNSKFENESGTVHGIYKVENFTSLRFSLWAFYGSRKLSFALVDTVRVYTEKSLNDGLNSTFCLPLDINTLDSSQQARPFLSLTDWVWDVRVIATDYKGDESKELKLLSAVGLAQNIVEIWSLSSMENLRRTTSVNYAPTLYPCKLRKIICDNRCITYSLSFFGWRSHGTNIKPNELDLAVGAGTVSNQILIWKAIDDEDGKQIADKIQLCFKDLCNNTQLIKKAVSHKLSGHLGVIYSVKFGDKGVYIASTSDDRTVRLWKRSDDQYLRCNQKENKRETAADVSMITDSEKFNYSLVWTGFGHAARVWDCDFIHNNAEISGIISSGEDGSLKVWHIDNGSLLVTLKGHACQSIWKIRATNKQISNVDYLFTVSGANDGSVNLWDLNYHLVDHHLYRKKLTLPDGQKVCDMCFYSDEKCQKLLIITKDGIVATLDPRTNDLTQNGFWIRPEDKNNQINPEDGSCVAVHPNKPVALVGTTKGELVLFSTQASSNQLIFSSAQKYLAIQSISWLDSIIFLAFHVKGIVTIWEYVSTLGMNLPDPVDQSKKELCIRRVLDMNNNQGVTIGVPISHYYDRSRQLLFIGDSRGNIAMFDTSFESENIVVDDTIVQKPLDLLIYAHKKEHVTGIIPTIDGRGIMSIGNDGCIHESSIVRDQTSLKLQKSLSRPISDLTGVSYLWRSSTGALIAGGYHGNDFVVVDVTTNNQLLCIDSGGRTRKIALWIDLQNTSSLHYTFAVCIANKKTPFEIMIHSSPYELNPLPLLLPYQLRVPYHGEAIYDVAACNLGGTLFVASGSNDCSIKLSVVSESSISLVKDLPPHESCIRALTFSQHAGSSSSIFIACGGKLITSVYRLDNHGGDDFSIHFLCTNKIPIKNSIDHRMNAVKAVPLITKDSTKPKHMMLAGDSDGGLHLTLLAEDLGQSRKVESRLLTTQGMCFPAMIEICILFR